MKIAPMLLAFALCSVPVAAHEGGHDARGIVTSVGSEALSIKTNRGEESFLLTPQTEFVKDGAPATAQDVKALDRVVVHAKKNAGRLEAVKVQFKSPARPKEQ